MFFGGFGPFSGLSLNCEKEMPILDPLVKEGTTVGWFERAGASVVDRATTHGNGCHGAVGAAPSGIVPRRPADRSSLAHDPNYPSEAVIQEVARRLANLFWGE
jgi:hypothetical protein